MNARELARRLLDEGCNPSMFAIGSHGAASEQGMRHDHPIGFFRWEHDAEALRNRLQEIGLPSWSDRIPYDGPDDPRCRVFVTGQAVFAGRTAPGRVPLVDARSDFPATTVEDRPAACSQSNA